MPKVRTKLDLEEDHLKTIKARYGVRTKTEVVDLALRHLAGQPLSPEEALAMRGTRLIDDLPVDSGPRTRK